MRFAGVFKLFTAFFMLSVVSATVVQASSLTFAPNNGAIFSNANPNGNAQMLATVVKPQNTGAVAAGAPGFSAASSGSLLAQSIFAQQETQLDNQVFSCGTSCAPSSPVGGIALGGGYTLSYVHNPDGTVSVSITDPTGATTTFSASYTGTLTSR